MTELTTDKLSISAGADGGGLPRKVLLTAMWLLVILAPVSKIADFDVYFHLRLGETLVEGARMYNTDEFTYTAQGKGQYILEWLSNGIIYLGYKYAGYYGLALIKSVGLAIICLIVFRTFSVLVPSGRTFTAAASIAALVFAMRFRLDLRPYYFTYLCAASFMYIFHRYKRDGKAGLLYLLPLVQVIWSNTHGGMIMGPPLVFVFVITEWIKRRSIVPSLLAPAVLTMAASGLSPEGFGPFIMLASFVSPQMGQRLAAIGEWQGLSTSLLWGYGAKYTIGFQIIAAGSIAYLIREALARRLDLFNTAVILFSLYYSIRHVRMLALSSVLLAPYFYLFLDGLVIRVKGRLDRALSLAASAAIICLIVFSVVLSGTYDFGIGKKDGVFPDGALRFLDENDIDGHVFNTVTVGSYMLWKSPDRKVFIDGRLIVPSSVREAYWRAIEDSAGFQELDSQYDFNYALIDYDPKYFSRFPLHLSGSQFWVPVYWDRQSVVYLKNSVDNTALVDKYGYKVLRPSFNDFTYLDLYVKARPADELLSQIDHDIALNPMLQDAHLAKAYVTYYYGLKQVAFNEINKALELQPDIPFEHISIAMLYIEFGKRDLAAYHLRKALEMEPSNKAAKSLLNTLG